jgi:hypothetical protein
METTNQTETTEVKRAYPYRTVDDSMSEWERARETSKTWSMEQD